MARITNLERRQWWRHGFVVPTVGMNMGVAVGGPAMIKSGGCVWETPGMHRGRIFNEHHHASGHGAANRSGELREYVTVTS